MISSHEAAKAMLAMAPWMMRSIPMPPKANPAGLPVEKNAKYKGKPESEFAKRLHALYNRRAETLWTVEEVGLLKELMPSYNAEDMTALERYYEAERKKGTDPKTGGHWRRDMATLLRNWNGEIDRARAHAEASQRKIRRSDVKPDNVVPMPTQDEERIRAQAIEAMQKTRAAL